MQIGLRSDRLQSSQSSTHANSTPIELIKARTNPQQVLWFQLYKKADNEEAANLLRHVEKLGFSAVCLTVDVAAHGNRETDLRTQRHGDDTCSQEEGEKFLH